MTQEQIQAGNKLIAEFMGLKYHPKTKEWTCRHPTDGQAVIWSEDNPPYNFSWNWLMPVWFKIQRYWVNEFGLLTSTFELSSMGIEISAKGCGFSWVWSFSPTGNYSELNAVWISVVEFIKWYNKNKEL